jgi:hypothetical protein
MALKYFAYIYLAPGFNAETNTSESESGSRSDLTICRFKAVGLDFKDKARVTEVAVQLVKEGVQLIELCGGFGPLWIAKVTEAIGGAVPVGSVAYGPEARKPILDLLSS